MLLKPVLKMMSLFLSLGVFLFVGAHALMNGEELIWAVVKALVAFIICWIVINWFAGLLSLSVESAEKAKEELSREDSSMRAGAAE